MANNRVFYACEAVGFAPQGSNTPIALHGGQSVGINTNFSLTPTNELGQLETYQMVEGVPDIEVTITKVLDGYPLAYLLATQGASYSTLAGRANQRPQVYLSIFPDTQSFASGTPVTNGALWCSGMYYSQVTLNFPLDGNFNESLTLVGNHKEWFSNVTDTPFKGSLFGPSVDSPQAVGASGGVNQKQHMVFKCPAGAITYDTNGVVNDQRVTVLPTQIRGISSSGTNDKVADVFGAHIGDISVTTSLGRDAINEQGRKVPYYRFITFPVDVNTSISVTASTGDGIDALENGGANGADPGSNLKDQSIRIRTMEGTFVDLGSKNKNSNITYGGGDATGGNMTITYNFTNQNALDVKHTHDPTTGLRCLSLDAAQFTN